ncbi:NIPSNAP family protein [Oceanobacillus picturae]|uniref:NIPSNAP family protein n=1 Tax=Oceanobacillus picturae TaxID=171693 RepID=UPI000E685557|nr:NIPSNAP family protein [Oceanobacillus picturae]RIU94853.1 cytoplasmic protein [Oceanobacillus picturae]
MFYRRKFHIVKNEFVNTFNAHFNETNLPNQTKYGARLIGRWMVPNNDISTEIFALWEYDSYEKYIVIEAKVKGDTEHVNRVNKWYEKNGGRDYVYKKYILEVKNEQLKSTLN